MLSWTGQVYTTTPLYDFVQLRSISVLGTLWTQSLACVPQGRCRYRSANFYIPTCQQNINKHTWNCAVMLCHYKFRHLRLSWLFSEGGFGGCFWLISWGLFGWGRFLLFFITMIFPSSHLEIHLYLFGFSAYSSPFGNISWNQSLGSSPQDFLSHLIWDRRHNHGAKQRSSSHTTHTGQHNLLGPAL